MEEIKSDDPQDEPSLDPFTLEERATPRPRVTPVLAWAVASACALGLLLSLFYAHRVSAQSQEQLASLEAQKKDIQDRYSKGEAARNQDRARAAELAGSNEELLAQKSEVENHLKDKDAQLVHLQQTHDALVTRLAAIVKAAHGRGAAKQVAALLPKNLPAKKSSKRRR